MVAKKPTPKKKPKVVFEGIRTVKKAELALKIDGVQVYVELDEMECEDIVQELDNLNW